ncbi:hypothetical protein K3495_g10164, partial [Podosphaera aphanis]
MADLLQLHAAIDEMRRLQEERFESLLSTSKKKRITKHEKTRVLSLLWTRVSHRAVLLLVPQMELAEGYLKGNGKAPPVDLFTHGFTQQHGLPCWHRIAELLCTKSVILPTELDKFWWLDQNMVLSEEELQNLLEIDPYTRPSRKQNQNAPQPTKWLTRPLAPGESSTHHRDESRDEPVKPRKKRRTQSQIARDQQS